MAGPVAVSLFFASSAAACSTTCVGRLLLSGVLHLLPGLHNQGCWVRTRKACQCTPCRPDPKLCSHQLEHKTEKKKESTPKRLNICHQNCASLFWACFSQPNNCCIWLSVCFMRYVDFINDDLGAVIVWHWAE